MLPKLAATFLTAMRHDTYSTTGWALSLPVPVATVKVDWKGQRHCWLIDSETLISVPS